MNEEQKLEAIRWLLESGVHLSMVRTNTRYFAVFKSYGESNYCMVRTDPGQTAEGIPLDHAAGIVLSYMEGRTI